MLGYLALPAQLHIILPVPSSSKGGFGSLRRLSVSCKADQANTITSDSTDISHYKERLVSNFERRSESYDSNNSLHPPLCRELVRRAKLAPGETVMDAACGTGYISLEAARVVGPSGGQRLCLCKAFGVVGGSRLALSGRRRETGGKELRTAMQTLRTCQKG